MKTFTHNVVKFFIILFLNASGSLSLPSNINQDNALNPYTFEITPLPFVLNDDLKPHHINSEENEIAINKEVGRWNLGIVYYYVDVSSYDYLVSYQIRTAMNTLESSTCIKFSPLLIKPHGNEKYIHITNQNKERDCNHEPLFKGNGEIVLVLGYDCLSNVNILHSLLHALGLKDAVTHPQRDKYIRVIWNNIQPAYRHLYNIQEEQSRTVEYDPMSIMHFSDRDYTVNGQPTIEPMVSGLVINPSETLSPLDKLRLQLLFGHVCNRREVHNILKSCRNTLNRNVEKKELETDVETLKESVKKPELDNKEDKEEENEKVTKSDTESDSGEKEDDVEQEMENKSEEKDSDKHKKETDNNVNAENKEKNENKDDSDHSNEKVTLQTDDKTVT